ncbi:MAG TPA: serine hydrolase domain-containing protein [Caulobacteraceae bacterium]|nr:serine hydrolase domain-containing protein [Caulobacteraceae bacterium]
MTRSFGAADAERLDAAARRALGDLKPAGFSVGAVAGGALVWSRGYGFADIESGRPQAPELRQRIGSITKTMVGLCLMALVEEGRLGLDDCVFHHVPEVVFHGDGEKVRLRHLLTHTSGIGEVATPEDVRAVTDSLWSEGPDSDVLGLFPRGVTLEIPPNMKWSYANLGYALLGEVVARAEKAPIAEVVRRRIFAPLGMADSDLLDQPHPDLATGYHRAPGADERELRARAGLETPEEPTVDGVNIRGTYLHIRGAGAAGAVQSTVPDMARYAAALLAGGGGIVRPETFATMIAPHWAPDPRMESWGLSFSRAVRFGRFMFGHGGGVLGGWNSMLLMIPDEDLALVIHANTMFEDSSKLFSRLLAATLGTAAPAPAVRAVSPDLLAAAPGVYEALPGELTNFRVKGAVGRLQVTAADGGLSLHARRGVWKRGIRLTPADQDDDTYFHIADDELEPSSLKLVRGGGAVTGLRYGLVEMIRTDAVPGWA